MLKYTQLCPLKKGSLTKLYRRTPTGNQAMIMA